MDNIKIFACSRCGKQWSARKDSPKQCPNCHSPYWNKPRRTVPSVIPMPEASLEARHEKLYGDINNTNSGFRFKSGIVKRGEEYCMILPKDWIYDYHFDEYEAVVLSVRIHGQGIYAIPDYSLSMRKCLIQPPIEIKP